MSRSIITLLSAIVLLVVISCNWRCLYSWGYGNLGFLRHEVAVIEFNTSPNQLDALLEDRNRAIQDGWIVLGKEDLVPTTITTGKGTVLAEYRLKGDYLAHVSSDRWSYRVQTEDSVFGMQRFSLHQPIMRNNVSEFFWQFACQMENLIHLDYDLVRLKVNNESFELYAIEEHFGQNFCSRRNLDGFILRFEDKGYWKNRVTNDRAQEKLTFENAPIDSYNTPSIRRDSSLWRKHGQIISDLKEWIKNGDSSSEIFDYNKLAKYIALADLCSGHHALVWFNLRFYFSPETQLLEPVAFDGDLYGSIENPIIYKAESQADCTELYCRLFQDSIFVSAYKSELNRMTTNGYGDKLVDAFEETGSKYQNILNWEYPRYKFSSDFIRENTATIQEYLKSDL